MVHYSMRSTQEIKKSRRTIKSLFKHVRSYLTYNIYFGIHPSRVSVGSIVFFPCYQAVFCCGIAGIIAIKNKGQGVEPVDLLSLKRWVGKICMEGYLSCQERRVGIDPDHYLGGKDGIDGLYRSVRELGHIERFYEIFIHKDLQEGLKVLCKDLEACIAVEEKLFSEHMGHLSTGEVETMSGMIDRLRDVVWCLSIEVLANIEKTSHLMGESAAAPGMAALGIFKNINTVLNSIDRLEVRGRDSAGISLMFRLSKDQYSAFTSMLSRDKVWEQFNARCAKKVLVNGSINSRSFKDSSGQDMVSLVLTYSFIYLFFSAV